MQDIFPVLLISFSDPMILLRFVVIYLLVIWISVIIWVVKDITNRTDSLILQVISVLMVLVFTPLGICVYLLIRPQTTLFERLYEREFREQMKQSDAEVSGGQKALQEELQNPSKPS